MCLHLCPTLRRGACATITVSPTPSCHRAHLHTLPLLLPPQCLYPALSRVQWLTPTPLRKMGVGMIATFVSFICAGFVQVAISKAPANSVHEGRETWRRDSNRLQHSHIVLCTHPHPGVRGLAVSAVCAHRSRRDAGCSHWPRVCLHTVWAQHPKLSAGVSLFSMLCKQVHGILTPPLPLWCRDRRCGTSCSWARC